MIKNIFIFLVIFLNQLTLIGQNLVVNYKFSLIDTKDEYGVVGFSEIKLITNNFESISFSKNIDTTVVIHDINQPHIQESSDFKPSMYKSFINGVSYSETFFSKYDLKDQFYSIKWDLTNNRKIILGYVCQEAKGNYRGRSYKAYFTDKIPIQNGPHNFDNLPGLILEVTSDDGVVSFKANKISNSDSEEIFNPFTNKKYINWDEFLIAYGKYFHKMINYKPEEDMTIVVPNRGIEIFVDKI